MKTKLVSLIILLSFLTINAQRTYVPDDVFESQLIQLGLDSGPLDNYVYTSKINTLETLGFSTSGITNITGLEDFVALKKLHVLGEVTDLSPIEGLTNLEYLTITNAVASSFNTRNLINLTSIWIDNTSINNVNLFSNNALIDIHLQDSPITQVKFPNSSSLKKIIINNIKTSTIDAYGADNLERLEAYYCSELKTIIYPPSSELIVARLRDNNKLLSLDLSKNTGLTFVEVYDNAMLSFINIQNGNNTAIGQSLKVKGNPMLTCIQVDDVSWSETYWTSSTHQFSGFSTDCNPNTTSIPDANFEQHLIDAGIDSDGTLNGKVLTADIENVESLVVSNKNITNLTGIEDFTNLTDLIASNNSITNIDVSKNTLLEKLFIANNNLSNIDLSKNTKIRNLDVSENQLTNLDIHFLTDLESLLGYGNQLSEINLISNKKLNFLTLNDNKLKQLDVRENTALFTIDVSNNELESLVMKNGSNTQIINLAFKATGNPNLTCIEVDDVTYSNTNWTKKDATASYSTECAPANDDCANAIPLLFGQETKGDVNNGTITNNSSCEKGSVIADVWFTLEVPETGEFSVKGTGLGGFVKFAIYDSCNSTNEIACGNNISLTNLTPNDIYYLKVWMEEDEPKGSSSKKGNASFTIIASESSTLSNEEYIKDANKLKVYPNPVQDIVHIQYAYEQPKKVLLYSVLGKEIPVEINNNQFNISNLSSGVYIVKFIFSSEKTITKKLIKKQ